MVASYKRKRKIEFKQRGSHGCVQIFSVFVEKYYHKRQQANYVAINFKLEKSGKEKSH